MWQKYLHVNNRARVFKARFLQTRVSKTWDASFLNSFKTLLTNDILSPHYASLQISPGETGLYFFNRKPIFSVYFDPFKFQVNLEKSESK